jgi:hypothetical protein
VRRRVWRGSIDEQLGVSCKTRAVTESQPGIARRSSYLARLLINPVAHKWSMPGQKPSISMTIDMVIQRMEKNRMKMGSNFRAQLVSIFSPSAFILVVHGKIRH